MKKTISIAVAAFFVAACVFLCIGYGFEYERVDTVFINEVKQSLSQGEPITGKYDYTLFDREGNILYSTVDVTEMSFEARISRALGDGDIVVDFKDDKIVFYTDAQGRFENMRATFIWFAVASLLAMATCIAVGLAVVYRRTLRPFSKLKDFAGEVAKGNLDSPLILDKYESFGSFGEAFDIMRNNLKESRLAEQKSAVEKRSLLQEIGHDIKTPLASIKAVAECSIAQGEENYKIILDKANMIENLVNDFYQATLEEEGQLNIYLTKHTSKEFAELIDESDYNSRVTRNAPAECDILYDKIRMGQIIDNIIANSYKYADTPIEVNMRVRENKFVTVIKDFGNGVDPKQLQYVMDRFYRGEKTSETLGQGLGLHICRKLIARMGGNMSCRNEDGFVVEIVLPIFGKN
ncbi:MAG: HAMP domain-containing histidine kinase [Clostridia bacterium]|nr:HAMP domain-containing histidine kinase [Clostridia bacterium]